jgi:hypothetical protein
MTLAALAQNQLLTTLLDALQPATGLVAGKTLAATLLSLDGEGRATAQVGDEKVSLLLAGPQAKGATLQPGATLILRIDAPEQPGGAPRATLLDVRPPPAGATAATPSAALPGPPASPSEALSNGPAALLQRVQASLAATPHTVAAGAPTNAPAQTSAPSPRALAGPLLGPALANQNSLAPLLANLRAVAGGEVSLVVPKPLLTLIQSVLAQTVPAERRAPSAEVLKQAVSRSGVFLDARQGQGQPVPPQGDLKASLQALRAALAPLVAALTEAPSPKADISARPAEAPTAINATDPGIRPPPPRRDGPLLAQPIVEPSLSAGDKPLTVTQTLLQQAESALDRLTLSQFASLPLDGTRQDQNQGQRLITEIPLAFQSGTTIMPLRVEREPERREAGVTEGPLWRVRFALDVEPMGPLQGVVTLQGRKVGVTLWAEREETSRMLRGAAPDLESALALARFENGTVDIHTGQPRVMQATAGQFLDRMS